MTDTPTPSPELSPQQVAAMLSGFNVDVPAVLALLQSESSSEQQKLTEQQESSITIGEAIDSYLAPLTEGTRRGYRTSLLRYRGGIEPICDQMCKPCLEEHGTVFRCRCDCQRCVDSRVSLPPQGELIVSAETMSLDNARIVATAARRIALKRARLLDANRTADGRSARRADGRGAEEMAIGALRALFKLHDYPLETKALKKPSRNQTNRRALTDVQLSELCHTTETGGDDPELDSLLVEFCIATGARRKGAYSLTVGQIEQHDQIIRVNDKGDKDVPMPVSSELIDRLLAHAIGRGGAKCDPTKRGVYDNRAAVFWIHQGRNMYTPLTARRFDTLHQRWHRSHGWAERGQVGYHHLRHTIANRLKAGWGQHVAQRYLRHADTGVTDNYGRCEIEELAAAMGELLGFEHLLVAGEERSRQDHERRFYGAEPGSSRAQADR